MTGFASPNHTQTPNDLFDVLLAEIDSLAELKVTLAVIRKTLGYHKKKDPISFRQLEKLTGMKSQAVQSGIEKAIARGTIEIVGQGTRKVNIYALVIDDRIENQYSDRIENQYTSVLKIKATKETTQKKKENTISPSGDGVESKPKAPREPNAMYDAINAVWKYTAGRNGQMAKMLMGTSTNRVYQDYNLETPITPDELRQWANWWRRCNPDLSIIEAPVKIQSSITYWQETQRPQSAVTPEMDLSVAIPFDPKDNWK